MRSKVDLPEPLRPTRQTRSPAATASSAPESRGVTPKVSTDVLQQKQRERHGEGNITGGPRQWGSLVCQDQATALEAMMRLMHDFPPSADRQVHAANWRQAPFSRWAFHHVRELVPSADIPNDPGGVHDWPLDRLDPGAMPIEAGEVRPLSFDEFLAETSTDGIVVVSRGQIVFERYANGMTVTTPHILMPVSKSLLGLVAGVLAASGRLEPDRSRRDRISGRNGPPPSRHARRRGLRRRLFRDLRGDHRLSQGSQLDPARPGRGAVGSAVVLHRDDRARRAAWRPFSLCLAEHRPARLGDRAGDRPTLRRSDQ